MCIRDSPTRVPLKRVLQESSARVPHQSVRQQRPTRVSYESVSRERHIPQECPTRVFFRKCVLQECSARVPRKSECHTGCPTRVHKSVPQVFPTRMRPTRVSHKSVSYKSVNNCLAVCFRIRVCIRVRGFHLLFLVESGRMTCASSLRRLTAWLSEDEYENEA